MCGLFLSLLSFASSSSHTKYYSMSVSVARLFFPSLHLALFTIAVFLRLSPTGASKETAVRVEEDEEALLDALEALVDVFSILFLECLDD